MCVCVVSNVEIQRRFAAATIMERAGCVSDLEAAFTQPCRLRPVTFARNHIRSKPPPRPPPLQHPVCLCFHSADELDSSSFLVAPDGCCSKTVQHQHTSATRRSFPLGPHTVLSWPGTVRAGTASARRSRAPCRQRRAAQAPRGTTPAPPHTQAAPRDPGSSTHHATLARQNEHTRLRRNALSGLTWITRAVP